MGKFPVDAPRKRVVAALASLGFRVVREGSHIMPNHRTIKSSTLRKICTQSGISRDDFLAAFDKT
jgi:predicted RNA binding protein YcfA (HicA-like mRNA interferase family)